MIRDAELRSRLARNAQQFARNYDWESNQDRYLNIVNRLTLKNYSEPVPQVMAQGL